MFGTLLTVTGSASLTVPMLVAVLAYLVAIGTTVIATSARRGGGQAR